MARITPKTNWVSNNAPLPSDFNRIEGNEEQAFSEIDYILADVETLNADSTTLKNDVIALNAAKLENKTMGARLRTTGSASYVIPAGTFYLYAWSFSFPGLNVEVKDSAGTWRTIGVSYTNSVPSFLIPYSGLIISDGTNARITEVSGPISWSLIQIA